MRELTALNKLPKVQRDQILKQLRSVTLEQRLLSLILTTMLNQLDDEDRLLSYVQKNLTRLRKINRATGYVPEIVEASNQIWARTFDELKLDVGISTFALAIVFRRPKPFKKIGVNQKDLERLNKNHGVDGLSMTTLKLVNLMLKNLDEEIDSINNRIKEKAEAEIKRTKEKINALVREGRKHLEEENGVLA